MRERLRQLEGTRARYNAIVARFGEKKSWGGHAPKPTILLQDVRDRNGNRVTDHLWFTVGKTFAALNLRPGDSIEFDATAKPYQKGYRGRDWNDDYAYSQRERDYRLSNPTNVRKVSPEQTRPEAFLFSELEREVDNHR